MNRKLQALVDEFSRDLLTRLPGAALEVRPRARKSVYIYVTPPDENVWDDEKVWDIVDSMAQKQVDTLDETGYFIVLLPRFRQQPAISPAVLREKLARWDVETEEGSAVTGRQGDAIRTTHHAGGSL